VVSLDRYGNVLDLEQKGGSGPAGTTVDFGNTIANTEPQGAYNLGCWLSPDTSLLSIFATEE
jgi:hypothetical protein